jgi:hypothetical protein
MKRRAVLALGLAGLTGRALGQANAHVSTTDPLVYALTKGKVVNAGRVRPELPNDEVEGTAKERLLVI